jgi:hypothetical protein
LPTAATATTATRAPPFIKKTGAFDGQTAYV